MWGVATNTKPVSYEGRPCMITGEFRVPAKPGRYGHSRFTVKYLDDNSTATVPVGKFTQAAKPLPQEH